MDYRDYPTVKPSDSFQVLSTDTEYLSDMRKMALREYIALAAWILFAIAVFACLAKVIMQ